MISKLDFVAIPSTDSDRTRAFYVDTLGLRPDDKANYEFWVGETCFGIWEPDKMGGKFAPQKNGHLALHVDDVGETKKEREGRGVDSPGNPPDPGVCHMAFSTPPEGNALIPPHRHSPRD